MSEDFIGGDSEDIFDPEVIAAKEDETYEFTKEMEDGVTAMLRRRKEAYARVFSEGETAQSDVDIVMKDFAHFCYGYATTYHPDSQKTQDMREGRKEVFYRIMDFTRLDHDTLMLKYHRAQLRGT